MNESISWGKIAVLVVAIASVGALGFVVGRKEYTTSMDARREQPVLSQLPASNEASPRVADVFTLPKDEVIDWYAQPKLIPSPQLFKKRTNEKMPNKAWEVGSARGTENKIIFVAVDATKADIPMLVSSTLSFLFWSQSYTDGPILYPLSAYSIDKLSDYADEVDINKDVLKTDNSFYSDTKIASLMYPGFLRFDGFTLQFIKQDYSDDIDDPFFHPNENPDTYKKVHTDPVYGDIFLNTEDGDFYLRSPFGTMEIYSLSIDFLNGWNAPPFITWNDGTKPEDPFVNGVVGCGSSAHVDDVTSEVPMDALVLAGKTDKGENIYEYKDKNAEYLKKWYEERNNYEKAIELGDFAITTSYDQFTDNHLVFFWRDPVGRLLRFVNTKYLFGGCGKPVIYLYPKETTDISVRVSPTAGMTASDPAYNDGWNVFSDPHSNITNLANGKVYPYLFWEGNSKEIYHTSKKGFVVSKEDLGGFLDAKLSLLGLIQKERDDFKEFWLPRMLVENKPYYFVTFVPQRTIDILAPLQIAPKPDTTIRVLMDYKGLDSYQDVPPLFMRTPERKGFTAVEWGGMFH